MDTLNKKGKERKQHKKVRKEGKGGQGEEESGRREIKERVEKVGNEKRWGKERIHEGSI